MSSIKRSELVNAAQQLFYQQGFKATGIDLLLAKAGVAKKTLYHHFASKDALIIAALEKRDAEFMNMLSKGVVRYSKKQTARAELNKIMALFDTISEWIKSDSFNGCMFINASAEYVDPNDPIHRKCVEHKSQVIGFIHMLLGELELNNTFEVAKHMALLIDGAIVNAHTRSDVFAAESAKRAALLLLHAHLSEQSSDREYKWTT